jgi:hypothetical protein
MLVEMRVTKPDHGDVYPLRTLGPERRRQPARGLWDAGRLGVAEIAEMVDVPSSEDEAVAEIGMRVLLKRRHVERDDVLIVPEQPAR